MQIKLAKGVMWLLGTPRGDKDDVISLNFGNPGPIDVDYDGLTHAEQKHVILSLRKGQISSPQIKTTEDIDRLAAAYVKENEVVERPVPRVQQKPRDPRKVAAEKLEKDQERAIYLARQTVSVIRSALTGEGNTRMLGFLVKEEEAGRNRKSVVKAVQTKIDSVTKQVTKHLEVEATRPPIPMELVQPGQDLPNVVESDEREIVLTEDQIKELASIGF
tara:strand:- start:1040 stop:1693 length:654 start_codon:yes stop_codon:yes gene_type:complete